jgi:hypothetical protein
VRKSLHVRIMKRPTADELAKLAKLHDEKKISDLEYEQAKAKIVG